MIPLLDLKAQYVEIESEIREAIDRVLESQRFILGPEVEALEQEIADYSGATHGIGVSSGTDALLVSLMALGVGPGDEVITTAYSFFATASVIARLGARPIFIDIDHENYNIAPFNLEKAITKKTKVIMPVHLFGQCADMDPILDVAKNYDVQVIEDAAQAIGAEYKGRRAGSMGALGCFSFFPSKNLGALGDAGMVVTSDSELADRVRKLRGHGASPKYYHQMVGGNFRLDALQAAVLRVKFKHLDDWSDKRLANALMYNREFLSAGLPKSVLQKPTIHNNRHVFNQYVIRTPYREGLIKILREAAIGCEIYYPLGLHQQECFAELGDVPDLPEVEAAAHETLALPIYAELTETQIKTIVNTVVDFLKEQGHEGQALS